MDAGTYPVSLICMAAKERPSRVHAVAHWTHGVDSALAATLEFKSGLLAQITSSFSTSVHRQALIAGTAGVMQTPFLNHPPLDRPAEFLVKRGIGADKDYEKVQTPALNGFRAEAESFAGLVRGTNTDGTAASATGTGAAARWDGPSPGESMDIALTLEAIQDLPLNTKEKDRTKNFFALGLVSWIYTRPLDPTLDWIKKKFAKNATIAEANARVLKAGHAFGETAEIFSECYQLEPAEMAPGLYRAMTGNRALAWGLLAAAERSKVPIVYGAYPITPASGILEELAMHKRFRIRTIQAEDEIAAASAAIGASFGGAVGVTASSGPGIALKGEAIGLAVTAELPLVIFDIQRGGPSTGLPTKTEQADLMQALYGRNSEAPVVVLAPATPGDCFFIAYEAVRIAIKYMVPVIVLSDGFLANGSEPWRIPDPNTLPPIEVHFRTDPDGFLPYLRDPATLGRPWVRPGTPGLEHRIGGIEKQDGTGDISYDPDNHDHMVRTRAEKVRRVAQEIPPTSINGPATGDLLVVGWGGTYGAITAAVERSQADGKAVASVHLRHLNPLPPDLGHILREYRRVLVPEINSGQLVRVLRAEYLVDAVGFNRVRGLPLATEDICDTINQLVEGHS